MFCSSPSSVNYCRSFWTLSFLATAFCALRCTLFLLFTKFASMQRAIRLTSSTLCIFGLMFYHCSTIIWMVILQAATSFAGTSYDYGNQIDTSSNVFKRQATAFHPTTGVHTGTDANGYGTRKEIRDLEKDTTTWTLYLLGLDVLQSRDQSDVLSWYQIAGIHGRPFQPFNGIQATKGNENSGYCTHISILFPTWHRPFLAFYEQVLYNIIQEVALYYPEGPARQKYTAAALKFRIPYWDWAAAPPQGQSVLPYSVGGSATVVVDGPNGRQLIGNPLFSYAFDPLDPSQLPNPPFNTFNRTLRYPLEPRNANSESHNNLVAANLDNSASSFRSRLYNLFSNDHNYSTFGNQAWIPNPNLQGYDSLESLHDQIHGLVGQGGQMGYIDYSAFDPTFVLHHTMLDRCFAMWQILNPNSWITPHPAAHATFTTSAGQEQNSQTALTPFYDANGLFWTSDGVRDTRTFGYAYAETIPSSNSPAQVVTAINRLYGSAPTNPKRSLRTSILSESGSHQEWLTNFVVDKNALGVPYFIHIFLGPFADNPFSWSFEPNLVASHSINHMTSSEGMSSGRNLISGTIPLTVALQTKIDEGNLRGLEPEYVDDYLATNFHFRMTYMNDTEVDRGLVPSLKLTIVSSLVTDPKTEEELPTWGEIMEHVHIT
ncbi:hypothetical protein BJ878DRAFT_476387 [Calycina marina]|uniref:Tyrosinase copper-binding domain-containing protein n=1 Tax=Calycina marina TaxID=1763456 RepID=A0A9P7ZAT5_9HELO|nr:hypothetical protein BJ878DRAFT_476387 [Calycina marina]